MDNTFARAMKEALDRTRSGDPMGATRSIQAALGGFAAPAGGQAAPATTGRAAAGPTGGTVIDGVARPAAAARKPAADDALSALHAPPPRMRMRLGKVVGLLRDGIGRIIPAGPHAPQPPAGPGRWVARSHRCAAGARDYRLYVPASLNGGAPRGLVVMLHGCTQTPEDFATGTRMNDHAEQAGLVILYPEQTRAENAQRCWNWFRSGDQQGAAGEPAILADMAASVAAELGVPQDRIFAAGLSAGGAMAAILGAQRPDIFAAVAVHSGLPAGAARDVASAFAAMRGGPLGAMPLNTPAPARTLVLHGTADQTVARANGAALYDAVAERLGGTELVEPGLTGRPWRRSTRRDAAGRPLAELIEVEGLGHAWSGGDKAGSYADPAGPDASAEMVRFFLS